MSRSFNEEAENFECGNSMAQQLEEAKNEGVGETNKGEVNSDSSHGFG